MRTTEKRNRKPTINRRDVMLIPAVDDHWSGVRRRHELYTTNELQQLCGVFRSTVVWPGGELKLTHFAFLWPTILHTTRFLLTSGSPLVVGWECVIFLYRTLHQIPQNAVFF